MNELWDMVGVRRFGLHVHHQGGDWGGIILTEAGEEKRKKDEQLNK
jgi:hypothetical protein